MDASTLWWLVMGALVAAELATGTFYLLMLALGAAAGALAAHTGLPETPQVAVAAVVGALSSGGWYLWRRRQGSNPQPLGTHADPDVTLDLGQTVLVTQWGDDGCAHVIYRGAPWTARLKAAHPDQPPSPGPHRICAMQGNQLIIEKV